jgi:hypothetical protein
MRLYVKPNTKSHNATIDYLRLYGLSTELQQDKRGYYLDASPPPYWQKDRREKFQMGVEQLKLE